ncbi:MAG TPA: site-specific tyrosine recombinase XerC [Phycisphaerae bacterium]|nr:site-specific tyrosine recombinase XerC [Phycisphaerae bacterium]
MHQTLSESAAWNDPQSLLFLSARYVEYLGVRNYSKKTVYRRQRELAYFRRFCEALGITQARQVTRAVVLSYQSHLFHYRKKDNTPLTVATQQHWLVCLTRFFSYLTRDGLVLYNPASDLELPRKEHHLPKVILSAAEIEAILSTPDTHGPPPSLGVRDRALLEVFYSTGIRRMELMNLDIGHLDLSRGVVHVVQGKGHKDRVVPIGARAIGWVEKYLAEVRPALCPSINEPALFLNSQGNRFTEGRLGQHVRKIIARSGVNKPGGCHLFRHAFATGLLQNGCDLRHIQIMLGHASLETTQLYTHLAIHELQEAHRRYHPASHNCPTPPPPPAESTPEP